MPPIRLIRARIAPLTFGFIVNEMFRRVNAAEHETMPNRASAPAKRSFSTSVLPCTHGIKAKSADMREFAWIAAAQNLQQNKH